jgi:hypothetical protein
MIRDAQEASSGKMPISYQPRALEAPSVPIWQRLNWRVLVFAGVFVFIFGSLFWIWFSEYITGGIHNYGSYKQVDLKAMSTFDMDQHYATMADIPEKWRNLEGQKVLMIGEMWASHSAGYDQKLDYFQLVYSKTKCCFSGPPLAQHFVDGNVVPGKHVYYYDVPVKVLGTIHVSIRKEGDVIKSIYHVDVVKIDPIEE